MRRTRQPAAAAAIVEIDEDAYESVESAEPRAVTPSRPWAPIAPGPRHVRAPVSSPPAIDIDRPAPARDRRAYETVVELDDDAYDVPPGVAPTRRRGVLTEDEAADRNPDRKTSARKLVQIEEEAYEIVEETPPVTLPPPSEEQRAIIEAVSRVNVIVDAVAGSGKTTTILSIAAEYPDMTVRVLTYNAKLKAETRVRSRDLELENIEVHTYHSFCVRYVRWNCYRDGEIMDAIYAEDGDLNDEWDIPPCDILIIDEAQDMTPLYFDVARLAAGTWAPRMVVLGDRNQSIYGFMGSDTRYITMADALWGGKWERHPLTTSYRVTRQIADMVNVLTGFGHEDMARMRAVKDGPKPVYLYAPVVAFAEMIWERARESPEDVFVLARSVRMLNQGSPVVFVANYLSAKKIPVYVPLTDDAPPNAKATRGKVIFSTYHQAKGLERKHVFVMGFDATHVGGDIPVDRCSNMMYVAVTRAKETLTIWHRAGTDPLPYIPKTLLADTCDYSPAPRSEWRIRWKETKVYDWHIYDCVTDMLRHLPDKYVKEMLAGVSRTEVGKRGTSIEIPTVVKQMYSFQERKTKFYEEVSNVTGTAIASSHEIAFQQTCTIRDRVMHEYGHGDSTEGGIDPYDAPRLLSLANRYIAMTTRLVHQSRQVKQFNWVRDDQMRTAVERIKAAIPHGDAMYEVRVQIPGFDPKVVQRLTSQPAAMRAANKCVYGAIDILTRDGCIYEIKAVTELTDIHFLQLLMYQYGMLCAGRRCTAYIYNVITDQMIKVETSDADLKGIMRAINHLKNHQDDSVSDDVFLARNTNRRLAEIINACPKCS